MKKPTDRNAEPSDLTAFAIAMCTDGLRIELERVGRAAEAACTLRAELGLDLDEYKCYCEREFGIPAQLLLGLLEYFERISRRSQLISFDATDARHHV